ncbi:MAG: hypothetical protein KBD78_11790 [Oligoflexales bacterium]|nr:hypothetical protein [Oligoflexales bacterium]
MKHYILPLLILSFLSTHAFSAAENQWAFCKSGLAYTDAKFTKRKPKADKVCSLPTAKEAGDPDVAGTRCADKEAEHCQLGAGGEAESEGELNVPRDAWFKTKFSTIYVRCECGCFTEDVELLTSIGWQPVGDLARSDYSVSSVRLAIPTTYGEYTSSLPIKKKDFVIGPEEKQIIKIFASNGKSLTMTENHPILVVRNSKNIMITAIELVIGDLIIDEQYTQTEVTSLESTFLPDSDNTVYNVNTNGETPEDHLILANGFVVGDVVWQNYLSAMNSRANNLLD